MSKTLEELGYEKEEFENCIIFQKELDIIYFFTQERMIKGTTFVESKAFTMEELKAIYKYCEDMGWLNEV